MHALALYFTSYYYYYYYYDDARMLDGRRSRGPNWRERYVIVDGVAWSAMRRWPGKTVRWRKRLWMPQGGGEGGIEEIEVDCVSYSGLGGPTREAEIELRS